MSISFVNTLLDELKEEMETYISAGTFYDTTPTIGRGVVSWGETEGKRPYVWFIPGNIPIEELMGERANVEIEIELHGYDDTDGYGNADRTHKLLKDVLYFLWNDYSRDVNVLGSVIAEGGVNEESGQSGFLLSFNIIIQINTTTIEVVE